MKKSLLGILASSLVVALLFVFLAILSGQVYSYGSTEFGNWAMWFTAVVTSGTLLFLIAQHLNDKSERRASEERNLKWIEDQKESLRLQNQVTSFQFYESHVKWFSNHLTNIEERSKFALNFKNHDSLYSAVFPDSSPTTVFKGFNDIDDKHPLEESASYIDSTLEALNKEPLEPSDITLIHSNIAVVLNRLRAQIKSSNAIGNTRYLETNLNALTLIHLICYLKDIVDALRVKTEMQQYKYKNQLRHDYSLSLDGDFFIEINGVRVKNHDRPALATNKILHAYFSHPQLGNRLKINYGHHRFLEVFFKANQLFRTLNINYGGVAEKLKLSNINIEKGEFIVSGTAYFNLDDADAILGELHSLHGLFNTLRRPEPEANKLVDDFRDYVQEVIDRAKKEI